MAGEIVLPYQHADVIERSGVDGTAFLKTGKRGDEFELTTKVDIANYGLALTLERNYRTLCNNQIVNIIKNGYSYSGIQVGFVVRNASVVHIQKLRKSVGGLNSGLAWVEARWRLYAVELA